MSISEHPLGTAPPSPPLSPSDERDIEAFGTAFHADRHTLHHALSSQSNSDRDPLLLKSKLQTEEVIHDLRRRRQAQGKQNLGNFYLDQNAQIHSLLKSMDAHISDAQEDEDSNRTAVSLSCPACAKMPPWTARR